MRTLTRTTVLRILGEQVGFISSLDLAALLADTEMHNVKALLRYQDGREVMPLAHVPAAIQRDNEREHPKLRDVSFPINVYDELAAQVGYVRGY